MPHCYAFKTIFEPFSVAVCMGEMTKGGQTAEMGLDAALSHRLAAFGAHGIIVVGKDSRFDGGIFQGLRTSHNIALQAVIPGRHRSLWAAELRCGHFRMTIDHIIGNKKENCSAQKSGKNSPQ